MPPVGFLFEGCGVAHDDETVLGASNAYVDPVLVLDEGSRTGAYHGDKNEVKFSALRAVDREHLVLDLIVREPLCDCVFLGVVRRDHIDVILCESLDGDG